jgi:3'(2'), 5'-bisphosphate nucleotidase
MTTNYEQILVFVKVWQLVKDASSDGLSTEIGQLKTAEEMMDAIDLGNSQGGSKGRF